MTASTSAYPALPENTYVARVERGQLCDLLSEVGPGAPTLCGGWDTAHLAAHLVAREASPMGVVNLVRPGSADHDMERLLAERSYDALVAEIRSGPPRLSLFGTDLTDKKLNSLEYFVHHEDVRRAGSDVEPRELPGWALDDLWHSLGFAMRALMRKAPVGAALKRSDTGELKVAAKGTGTVVVEGLASELVLFAYGRGAHADVTLDGKPDDVAALKSASFGF